jgi:hypothetical protein
MKRSIILIKRTYHKFQARKKLEKAEKELRNYEDRVLRHDSRRDFINEKNEHDNFYAGSTYDR